MKILQLIQKPQLRGAEVFASQLSNHLRANGHAVQMISLLPGDDNLPFSGNLIKLNRPQLKRLIDVRGWWQLAQHIREIQPDVVQANAGDTLKFAVLSKLIFRWKIPIVYRNANKVSDFITSRIKLVFNRFLVGKVTHVISVSELCRQDFIRTYSFKEERTTMIPIGIELASIDGSVPSELRSFFATGNVLVNVASFVREKNHIGLLRIVKRLRESGDDVKLLLIGDGHLRPWIQEQVTEMNLGDAVLFTGYRNDVLSLVSNAKAFVLTSLIEGLPGVILEAMYCRTQVIAYDVGGISEVVKSNETGWLIEPGDESAFASAIRKVLSMRIPNPATERAYELVVSDYANTEIAKKFSQVYRCLS